MVHFYYTVRDNYTQHGDKIALVFIYGLKKPDKQMTLWAVLKLITN